MIRDQLIEHTNDAKVRETLLLEPDDLSLSRAITIAVRIESAAACASALTKQQTIADCPAPCPMPPSTLQPSQNDTLAAADSSTVMLLRRQQRSRPRPQAQTPRPCDNCGSSSHLSRAQNCPARGQTCRNCGKRNHFASVSAELKQLLDIGIIEPVDASPWVSNLVVAQKKSGALRVCADLRALNKAVIPDRFPLPTSEELIAQFHGSTVFSKLDLRQGYLRVPLHPSSRNLTAFVTHAGVAIYLDDVVIHGPTPESHDESLSRVFAALAEHKLTLNAEKCIFSAPTIEYVGFQLSADGVTPLRSNIDAILAIPEPSSAAQVASFLGMTGYYLKFLPHYSATTAPLRQLLRKDEPWVWTQACSNAVRALKVQLTTAPVLAHFDISSPTWVTCDASATAIGAVLSQTQRGVEKPIAFASRAFNQTEQRYSVEEREALACIWACERWHLYLYGRAFTLRTDHQALTALLSTSGTGHRPLRLHPWSDRLRQYNFDLKFTPGRDNVVADLLSHSPPPHPNTPIHTDTDQVERDIVQMLHAPLQAVISLQELKEASEQDPVLSQLRVYILNGWPQEVPEGLAAFSRIKQELSCWNDTCVARGLCTVIPSTLRARVLAMAHEGHLGIVKLKQRCFQFDLSARVKVPDIKATDWVRVRRPHRDNKLASYWSAPLQVTHQLGPATFLLSDGTRWHASRLRKVPPLAHTTGVTSQATPTARQDTPALQLTPRIAPAQAPDISTNLPAEICACPSQAAQPHPRVSPRPVRIRSRPGHLQDFVSTFHV
ncbi:gypsy-16 si [Labeo rohita]|uniref:ribonuclease H n=1 Tax=Labeo rohita TaxID=84645 RepID=A0A498NS53_LABRO|nr:gypsy-16 si [Labeo rohita]